MPQVQKTQKPTATSIQTNKAFRDRLRDRYKPSEWVRVKNIDNEPFEWQYFPSDGEDTFFDDGGQTRHITGRASFVDNYSAKAPGNEQLWSIDAGESEVLIGECADLFIDGLYKRLVAKNKIAENPDLPPTQARSFNFSDGLMQEQYIDHIFQGIETPAFKSDPVPAKATK